MSPRRADGGALYVVEAGALRGRLLPVSYVDSAQYWGAWVCGDSAARCAVTDSYDADRYTLTAPSGPAGLLQVERHNVHNGTSIYDAAAWQIAVVLGAVVNRLPPYSAQQAYELAGNQDRLLAAPTADGATAAAVPVRATTRGATFRYNDREVTNAAHAYAFRMLPRSWLSDDPLLGSRYDHWITTGPLPVGGKDYRRGALSWSDWKPLTGENAWALLIGPLQAARIRAARGTPRAAPRLGPAPRLVHAPHLQDLAVQNALRVLPTFAAMQSPLGAVYYAPSGTAGNVGGSDADPHAVSVENNASLYAGLRILERTLRDILAAGDIDAAGRRDIDAALETVHTMIHGGELAGGQRTRGLLAFFRNSAWRDAEFVQGGRANVPGAASEWLPAAAPRAIDANTWTIAALGAAQVDEWFGFGAAYATWGRIKRWGGYGVQQTLWGVGYSDIDGNGVDAQGNYRQGVLSAEWTAGAITMVRNLLRHYASAARQPAHALAAQRMLVELQRDETSMLEHVQSLRQSRYRDSDFPGRAGWEGGAAVPHNDPYLYASRRYFIPFGWYANPLPSTCATAWMIMVADHFDPFGIDGLPN